MNDSDTLLEVAKREQAASGLRIRVGKEDASTRARHLAVAGRGGFA